MPSSRRAPASRMAGIRASGARVTKNTSRLGSLLLRGGGKQHPLDAGAEPDPPEVGSPEVRDETVVAAAGTDGVLRPEGAALRLEDRHRVVVEAAHEPVVDLVRDAERLEALAHGGEVRGGLRRSGTR